MSVKENVLLILEKQKMSAVSGEEIAQGLGCTRAAVNKAVKELVADGYHIAGVKKAGYTLMSSGDVLSKAYIEDAVKNAGFSISVITEKCVDSTNNLAKAFALKGVKDDLVIIAEEQTAGRGRRGRSFYSPKGSGVYLSFLLHPKVPVSEAVMLTTLAVTAESFAVEQASGIQTSIKWVNDLYSDGKKISGILTEGQTSVEDNTLDYAIVGIGINLYEPEGGFPDDIKDIAGAVFKASEKRENIRNRIVSELIIRFLEYYREFPGRSFIKDYEKKCMAIGRDVAIITSDHESVERSGPDRTHAHVLGIDENCRLIVIYEDGTKEHLSSGEISIRMAE